MKPDIFLRAVRDAGIREIGRPLSASERARWKARHPGLKLPNDLLGFLKRANGLTFAAGRLLSLREIRSATEILYHDQESEDETLPESWLGLTDDEEVLLVFDVRSRRYLSLDDEAEEIGDTFEAALDWLWARYLEPNTLA